MSKINKDAPEKVTKEHLDRAITYYKEHKNDKTPIKAKDIIECASQVEGLDARSAFGKELLLMMEEFDIFLPKAHQYIPKNTVKLTENQEDFIRNNASKMKWFDCARTLFDDVENLTQSSNEAKAVKAFYNTLPESLKLSQTHQDSDTRYHPPKTLDRVISRVNQYILHGINKEKITNAQKNDCNALIGYLNNHRFTKQINQYDKIDERESFEDAFIRYTYDKSDLSQEEIDQYILLASEVVSGFKNQRVINLLQMSLEEEATRHADGDDDRGTLSIKLAEQIKAAQEEHNKCVARQGKLISDLQGKRSDRIKNRLNTSGSFLNVIDAWKQEETRKKMLKFAERRREALAQQIDEFETMDEMKAEFFGITREELLEE